MHLTGNAIARLCVKHTDAYALVCIVANVNDNNNGNAMAHLLFVNHVDACALVCIGDIANNNNDGSAMCETPPLHHLHHHLCRHHY